MKIIHALSPLSPQALPKPKDFLGTDEDWKYLQELTTSKTPEPVPQPTPERESVPVAQPAAEAEPVPVTQPTTSLETPKEQLPVGEPSSPPVVDQPFTVPDWLGEEVDIHGDESIPPPPEVDKMLPIDNPNDNREVPTGISTKGPPSEYQEYLEDEDIKKIVPKEELEIVDPSKMFEEVLPAETPLEERNRKLDVEQKIWYAMSSTPTHRLRIEYDTLPKPNKPSLHVSRLVLPQYVVFHNGRHQFFLYTQPDPQKKGDYGPLDADNPDGWKSFAINNIKSATLEE